VSLTVDVPGAAELMKVHPETVKKMILAGELRAAQVGRAYVMLTKDVLDLIENAIVKETAARLRRPIRSPKTRCQVAAS
jgi:excisionase family DNA binding protein